MQVFGAGCKALPPWVIAPTGIRLCLLALVCLCEVTETMTCVGEPGKETEGDCSSSMQSSANGEPIHRFLA